MSSSAVFLLALIFGVFMVFAATFVLMAIGVISYKIRLTVCRHRRGRAIDLFQKVSWGELRDQLKTLNLVFGPDVREYYLKKSLDLFGFKPSARAFGSCLNQRLIEAQSTGKDRGEILIWAIDKIVSSMDGSLRKTIRFYEIASRRHGLSWATISPSFVPKEGVVDSVRRYKTDRKTILQKKRSNSVLARARKTLGTDK